MDYNNHTLHCKSTTVKSVFKMNIFSQIPQSEIYEPAAVGPRRGRNRASTIANQREARIEMEIAASRAQAATKIPTVFK